jgi:RNA polymerase subunit RPABC4/transcription elongation factor Spt4
VTMLEKAFDKARDLLLKTFSIPQCIECDYVASYEDWKCRQCGTHFKACGNCRVLARIKHDHCKKCGHTFFIIGYRLN